jgi:hypothetical protein
MPAIPKKKRLKKDQCPALEKKLDNIFSRFVRLSDAHKRGILVCFTCRRPLEWAQSQCGHYISRGHKAVRFDENNCRPQCFFCNAMRQGEAFLFREHLVDEVGLPEVERLEAEALQTTKRTSEWYHEKIAHYTEQVRRLDHSRLP